MIRLKNIGKAFGSHWIFRHLNLEVASGESLVLLGPSGSGKSVLLKTLAGLLRPTEGTLELGSKNLGMLFQKNALFDSLTLLENLLFPLKERLGVSGSLAEKKARPLLEAVGLGGCESLYPDEISGGMQKRLGIARALIVEPEILFYDEPTAGLDPITSRTIAELILRLKQEWGTTVVTVTNDVKRAYQLADRITLLALGKLSEPLPPDAIRQTEDPAIKQFIYGLKEGPLSGSWQ
jgi:phospholipid/cholesterol/gamma-HCH transport system ATP-binding protein